MKIQYYPTISKYRSDPGNMTMTKVLTKRKILLPLILEDTPRK